MIMNIPKEIYAGGTYYWIEQIDEYPASSYSLKIILRNGDRKIEINGTSSGNNYEVSISNSQSASWIAGEYECVYYFYNSNEHKFISAGYVKILPNILTTSNKLHEEIVLEAIEAAIERRATKEQLSYSINGRSLQYMSLEELIKARSFYQYIVNVKKGKIKGYIPVRFNEVR